MEHECEYCEDQFDEEFQLTMHRTVKHLKDVEDRFWDRVDKGVENECWEWQGHKNNGYGCIRHEGTYMNAQRAYFVFVIGIEMSDDVFVLHKCDNKPCVNPNHLYLGTHQDNMEDYAESETSANFAKSREGENNPNAKLSESQVIEIYNRCHKGEELIREIAEDYPVEATTITNIKNGYTHKKLIDEYK